MTERLYYSDSFLTIFDACVVEIAMLNGSPAVRLDRTAFYPTGGGQPHDTGDLNGIRVIDVIEREEDETPFHVLEGTQAAYELQPGDPVKGIVDWSRRFDHTSTRSLPRARRHLRLESSMRQRPTPAASRATTTNVSSPRSC